MGTFMLRMVMERAIEKQKVIYMYFKDFEKVFDTVRNELLMDRMKSMGVDDADLGVLCNLYWG